MHTRARSRAQHLFHHVLDQVGDARIDHLLVLGLRLENRLPVLIADILDEAGADQLAIVRKDRVGAGDLERRHFISAERDGWRRFDVHIQPGCARRLCDLVIADHLRDFHGGDVQRMRQRVPDGNLALVFLIVILRLVGFFVEPERGRLIHDHRSRCDHRAGVGIQSRAQRGGVDERLERRARLPFRDRVIELADAVAAPADQRLHFAGLRIQTYQRNLRERHLVGAVLLRPALPLLIGFLDAGAHRRHSVALQIHVERGEDAERRRLKIPILKLALQGVIHQVDEVGRIGRFGLFTRHLERRDDRVLIFFIRDESVLVHRLEHDVAPRLGPLRVAEGIASHGGLHQAG